MVRKEDTEDSLGDKVGFDHEMGVRSLKGKIQAVQPKSKGSI